MPDAAAQYKKQDGAVSISADGTTITWISNTGALPPLSIAMMDIANLQQTPANSAKASIKLVVQDSSPQAGSHTITFTSKTARDDQQTMTSALRKWIEALKSQNISTPTHAAAAVSNTDGASSTMAMARTVAATRSSKEEPYDDQRLLADLTLQMSLLNSSPALRQRFDRALQDKPDSVSITQFSNQFWSTRVHMLRSHATEKSQATGTYNVLSVIKSKTVNGTLTLSLTKEQIELLFRQHPVVQKAYNENVPQLSEGEFWERFFNSRLMKKLKGERILEKDVLDPRLDKYLTYDETASDPQELLAFSIPHFIDIQGNENNHSQKQGNRPDFTMNPANYEKAPILRVLNRMSEKMMKEVPSTDASRHAPAGLDEETYKELQLRDLQRTDQDNRVVLQVQDQSRFFSAGQSVHKSARADTYSQHTPTQALMSLRQDLEKFGGMKKTVIGIGLGSMIDVNDDSSSSDEESGCPKGGKIGSRSSRKGATSQIASAIRRRQLHDDDLSPSKVTPTALSAKQLDVAENTLENLALTHNTTVEFLHYFWAVFHSGDPDRANEAAKLIETLDKSLDRIEAVAQAAEAERATRVDRLKQNHENYHQRNAKKRKFDPNTVKGGSKAVYRIVDPLLRAIGVARTRYQEALREQLSQSTLSNGP